MQTRGQKLKKKGGLYGLYLYYCYRLGYLPKYKKQNNEMCIRDRDNLVEGVKFHLYGTSLSGDTVDQYAVTDVYKRQVNARVKGTVCPVCAEREVLVGYNDLATTDSQLLSEWDYEQNKLKPTEVSRTSAKRAWWKCRHGHS